MKLGGQRYERAAMQKILDRIKQEPSFQAEILDIVYYKVEWILENCKDQEISEAYRYLKEKYKVGKQYEWFALLCKKLDVRMESAIVHDNGKLENAILEEGG